MNEQNVNAGELKYVSAGREEVVDVAPLNVDYTYQRPIRSHHKKIAAEWHAPAAGRLLVGRRKDGTLWIVDGQQRREAMLLLGITKWKALVFESDGTLHEAELYTVVNGGRGTTKPLTHREQFKGQLASQDPVALAVVRAVEGAGLKIPPVFSGTYFKWPYVTCTKYLYDTVAKVGEEKVGKLLSVATRAFPQTHRGVDASVLQALWHTINVHKADPERLVQVLNDVPVERLVQQAKVVGANNGPGTRAALYMLIAARYNRGLKKKQHIAGKMTGGPKGKKGEGSTDGDDGGMSG